MKKFLRKWLPKIGLALKSDQDWAYEQRDIAALISATLAIYSDSDFSVSMYQDDNEDWDDEWRTVLQISNINGDGTGQVSWHLGPKSQILAKEIFVEQKLVDWDGTDWSKELKTVERFWNRE